MLKNRIKKQEFKYINTLSKTFYENLRFYL